MKVQVLKNLLTGEPFYSYAPETEAEAKELGDVIAEMKRPYPPAPGPDGLPYIKKLPPLPRGADRKIGWKVQLLRHPSQPVWQPILCQGRFCYRVPEDAPVFYTADDAIDAANRAAIRLGVEYRDEM
jgi:hypothetical protein